MASKKKGIYRNVETTFWTDPEILAMGSGAKLLALYLITSPHGHVSGFYYLPNIFVVHEAGLPADKLDTLWDTLSGVGFCVRDPKYGLVWVRNMLAKQGVGAKTNIAAAAQLSVYPKSSLVKEFIAYYPAVKGYYHDRVCDRVSRVGRTSPSGAGAGAGAGAGVRHTPLAPRKRGEVVLPSIPESLDTPEFAAAWAAWAKHRAERKPKLGPTAAGRQLAKLAGMGVERAIAAIEHSIAGSYQGIFEPNSERAGGSSATTAAERRRAEQLRAIEED